MEKGREERKKEERKLREQGIWMFLFVCGHGLNITEEISLGVSPLLPYTTYRTLKISDIKNKKLFSDTMFAKTIGLNVSIFVLCAHRNECVMISSSIFKLSI